MAWIDAGCAQSGTLILGPCTSTGPSFSVNLTRCNTSGGQKRWPPGLASLDGKADAAMVWVLVLRDGTTLSEPVQGWLRYNDSNAPRLRFAGEAFQLVEGACREGWDWQLNDAAVQGCLDYSIRLRVKVGRCTSVCVRGGGGSAARWTP